MHAFIEVDQENVVRSLVGETRENPAWKEDGPFGPISKLAHSGCFGPFPMGRTPSSPMDTSHLMEPVNVIGSDLVYETGGTLDKRRRIYRSPINELPHNQRFDDTNYPEDTKCDLIPPLQTGDPTEILMNTDEALKTVEVGQLIGFEIEGGDPILMEAMAKIGENPNHR